MRKGHCPRCDARMMPGGRHVCAQDRPVEEPAPAAAPPEAARPGPAFAPFFSRKNLVPMLIVAGAAVVVIASVIDLLRNGWSGGSRLYVDSSLSLPVAVDVDGKEVGHVFPDLMQKYDLGRGKRKITLRDGKGAVVEEIEADLTASGPYIYNPGAKRKYELKTINYSRYGLGGEDWTRAFGPGRWHQVSERVDFEFEHPPETISGNSGSTKTWLRRAEK